MTCKSSVAASSVGRHGQIKAALIKVLTNERSTARYNFYLKLVNVNKIFIDIECLGICGDQIFSGKIVSDIYLRKAEILSILIKRNNANRFILKFLI